MRADLQKYSVISSPRLFCSFKGMRLKYRYQDLQLGEYQVRLRVPINLDEAFARQDRVPGISREAFPLFGILWASSEVLACLMLEEDIGERRFLEVGCGLGLASLVLRLRGADVTAMDIHPLAEDLLAANLSLNACRSIPFAARSWSDEDLDLGSFDLVIGSDILYEPKHSSRLPAFLDRHIAPGGQALIVDPDRGQLDQFQAEMDARGFSSESWAPEFVDHLDTPYLGKVCRFSR